MTTYRSALDLQEQVLRANFLQVRNLIPHNGESGALVENIFQAALKRIVPERVGITSGFVVDSIGNKSRQLDVICYDKLGLPALFDQDGVSVISIEATFAAGEVKTTLNSATLQDAYEKCRSYKSLQRAAYLGTGVRGYSSSPMFHIYGEGEAVWPSLFFVLALDSMSLQSLLDASLNIINTKGYNNRSKVDTIMVLGANNERGSVLVNGTLGSEVADNTKISFVCQASMNLKAYPAESPWALFCYLFGAIMAQAPEFLVNYTKYDDGRPF